jgi:hypothetical protein
MSLYNRVIAINTGTKLLAVLCLRGNRPTSRIPGTLIMKRILRWSFVGVHVHVGVWVFDALLSISLGPGADAEVVGEANS